MLFASLYDFGRALYYEKASSNSFNIVVKAELLILYNDFIWSSFTTNENLKNLVQPGYSKRLASFMEIVKNVSCSQGPASPSSFSPTVSVYRQACSGIPLAVGFVGRDRRLWNSMVQEIQRFRQVRAASCEIPYVLCGGLYCLRCRWLFWGGPCPPLYIREGGGLHWKS